MFHLANAPIDGTTWQRPQIPRPPHTLSRSTPSWRAASSTVVPSATSPDSPDGVNTTRCVIAPSPSEAIVSSVLTMAPKCRRSLDAAVEGELAEALLGVLGVEARGDVLGGGAPGRRRTGVLTRRHWATSSWAVTMRALRLARSIARWNFGSSTTW